MAADTRFGETMPIVSGIALGEKRGQIGVWDPGLPAQVKGTE